MLTLSPNRETKKKNLKRGIYQFPSAFQNDFILSPNCIRNKSTFEATKNALLGH